MNSRNNIQNIVFVFPYYGVGGVSILFSNLANYLANQAQDINFFICDFKNGFLHSSVRNEKIGFIEYDHFKKSEIPENSIIIMQANVPWSMFLNLDFQQNTRLFMWHLHPHNLKMLIPSIRTLQLRYAFFDELIKQFFFRPLYIKLQKFTLHMLNKNALFFMDGENLNTTSKHQKIPIGKDRLLPLPYSQNINLKSNHEHSLLQLQPTKKLILLWVGRLVDFKYFPLIKLIEEINDLSTLIDKSIEMTIVGDGPKKIILEQQCKNFSNLSFNFIDYVASDQLYKILDKTNIMFAMGTSALEGASRGIPTVLLNYSYKKISHQVNYRWVYESVDYNLGSDVSYEQHSHGNNLIELFSSYLKDAHEISYKTRNYFQKNHEIKEIAEKFLWKVKQSDAKFEDLRREKFFNLFKFYKLYFLLKKKLMK